MFPKLSLIVVFFLVITGCASGPSEPPRPRYTQQELDVRLANHLKCVHEHELPKGTLIEEAQYMAASCGATAEYYCFAIAYNRSADQGHLGEWGYVRMYGKECSKNMQQAQFYFDIVNDLRAKRKETI